jgi:hypothetical protein
VKNYRITKIEQIEHINDEPMKKEAWEIFKASSTDEERIAALLMVINSHYIRSSRLVDLKHNPDFATFASHWLWANRDGWAWCPKRIVDLLEREYPKPEFPMIRDGRSHWETKNERGGVYLIKSGRYYKIGMSSQFNQRINQINSYLPEPVEVIHKIYTYNPSKIERYWHDRFASKRQNGEWFLLTDEDVAEFKSQTEM